MVPLPQLERVLSGSNPWPLSFFSAASSTQLCLFLSPEASPGVLPVKKRSKDSSGNRGFINQGQGLPKLVGSLSLEPNPQLYMYEAFYKLFVLR